MSETIRVMIVEDHFFTRMGMAQALSLESGISVVAQASCGSEAINLFAAHLPDVTILDGQLPDMRGTDVAKQIMLQQMDARMMMFSIDEAEEDIHRAVQAGVSGYVAKSACHHDLVQGVRRVAEGRRFFPPCIQERLRQRMARASLSAREIQVLECVAKGQPNKIIAADLGISVDTVKTLVGRIMEKLAAEDRTQAVVTAWKRGWIRFTS
jgi:DNA-binding NarL/FixJ family response regulator